MEFNSILFYIQFPDEYACYNCLATIKWEEGQIGRSSDSKKRLVVVAWERYWKKMERFL